MRYSMAASAEPITIHIPPNLTSYARHNSDILTDRDAKGVAVGAFVFAHPPHDHRTTYMLLIQRPTTDGTLASKWEVPGGGTEDYDPTILHSTARELFEEVGLHMTSVVDKVGVDHYFSTRSGLRVVKLSFEVRVQETTDNVPLESIPVELSHEHQSFAWATQADVEEDKYPITHPEQREQILEAFRQHVARQTNTESS